MDLYERYKDIVEQYPPFITKIQFCKITGICKSTVGQLIRAKQISYKKRRKKLLHYYDIPLIEALQYKYDKDFPRIFTIEFRTLIEEYYTDKLLDAPDALSIEDIVGIIGYTRKTVQEWLSSGEIEATLVSRKYYVAKDDFMVFLISGRFQFIHRKSKRHLADIDAIKRMSLAN